MDCKGDPLWSPEYKEVRTNKDLESTRFVPQHNKLKRN